mmetsp:Transcript_21468/g.53740  ORF Transcript_21468/g.53740 Transcript_21468/m.53740 type:complete len:322 (+) Transcript_21468:134-1099(+)
MNSSACMSPSHKLSSNARSFNFLPDFSSSVPAFFSCSAFLAFASGSSTSLATSVSPSEARRATAERVAGAPSSARPPDAEVAALLIAKEAEPPERRLPQGREAELCRSARAARSSSRAFAISSLSRAKPRTGASLLAGALDVWSRWTALMEAAKPCKSGCSTASFSKSMMQPWPAAVQSSSSLANFRATLEPCTAVTLFVARAAHTMLTMAPIKTTAVVACLAAVAEPVSASPQEASVHIAAAAAAAAAEGGCPCREPAPRSVANAVAAPEVAMNPAATRTTRLREPTRRAPRTAAFCKPPSPTMLGPGPRSSVSLWQQPS